MHLKCCCKKTTFLTNEKNISRWCFMEYNWSMISTMIFCVMVKLELN